VLLVADPFRYFPDYAPDVPDAELAQLGADAPGGAGAPRRWPTSRCSRS
jgi:hypothetical protein